jgi:hypothetical protein
VSNMATLRESNNDPCKLWSLANMAPRAIHGCKRSDITQTCLPGPRVLLGKERAASLPTSVANVDGSHTVGDKAAADRLNSFNIDKVNKLREKTRGAASAGTLEWPPASAPFSFTFVRAARVIKTIRGLNSTEALGLDGVPVRVLKKGAEVIGYPLAHVINRSMHTGVFPDGFKSGLVYPVHKGAGKSRAEAASFQPVLILPALSKVLETFFFNLRC